MASSWIERRNTSSGAMRYRVRFRVGGAESRPRYAGSFRTLREARLRCRWVDGELASMRVPDLSALREPEPSPSLREVAVRWQASRVDVRPSTRVQHQTALARVLPVLGDRPIDAITSADVAGLVVALDDAGKARESIRKSVTAMAMVFDFAGVSPNPARDRVQVRLPREEPAEPEPPSAEHVEAVASMLAVPYLIALLVLDATGVRVGELEAAKIGDLDEQRKAWLVRAAISKTRRPRWVSLPDDLFDVVIARLPAREDRDPSTELFTGVVTADRLRMAISRACRDAGVPHFSPHALRHRRISLLHRQGSSWAEIGERVGQRSKIVTADRYTHALVDYREIDRTGLLERVHLAHTRLHTNNVKNEAFAGTF
jgi:integrase